MKQNHCMLTVIKIISIHPAKACRGRRSLAPLTLKFGTRWRWVINFTSRSLYPQEINSVPTELEAGWAPERVWVLRRRENIFCPFRGSKPEPANPWPGGHEHKNVSTFWSTGKGRQIICVNWETLRTVPTLLVRRRADNVEPFLYRARYWNCSYS